MSKNIHSALMLKGLAALFFTGSFAAAQTDSTFQNIETVKIYKLLPKEKNKQKIEVSSADLLNHDAGKFLNSVPEIGIIKKSGNYASDPVLRGFKYEQLNIVADGISTAVQACGSRMDPPISQVNMNMVQEAEIFKGPYHFRHGNAFGGTINFITMKPDFTDEFSANGRFSAGYESNGNVTRSEAFAGVSSKKAVLNFFGSYQKGDNYKDGSGREVKSYFTRYNVGSKLSFKWNENQFTTFQINTNQGRDVGFAALMMDLIKDNTWMYQLQHQMIIKNHWLKNIDFNSYYSGVDHTMGMPDGSSLSHGKSQSFGGRAELKFAKKNSTFFTGIDYRRDHTKAVPEPMQMMHGSDAWQDSHVEDFGWFNEFQQQFRNAKLNISYRLDYNRADANEMSHLFEMLYGKMASHDVNHNFSAVFTQNLNRVCYISLMAGHAERSGSLTERFMNRFPGGLDAYEILGNPFLKPEKNSQADLVFTHKTQKVYFQADVFYSLLKDYISGVIRPDIQPAMMMSPGVRQMQNIPNARKYGFESQFRWQFLPKFRTDILAAYTFAENTDTKVPLPEIAPFELRTKLEADFNPVSLAAGYRFAARQNRIDPSFGELKTKDFSVFDVSANYKINKNIAVNFGIDNLFNRLYSEHLNRKVFKTNERITAPGRSYNVMFSAKF